MFIQSWMVSVDFRIYHIHKPDGFSQTNPFQHNMNKIYFVNTYVLSIVLLQNNSPDQWATPDWLKILLRKFLMKPELSRQVRTGYYYVSMEIYEGKMIFASLTSSSPSHFIITIS